MHAPVASARPLTIHLQFTCLRSVLGLTNQSSSRTLWEIFSFNTTTAILGSDVIRRVWNMVRATVDRDASRLMLCFAPAIFIFVECGAMLFFNNIGASLLSLGTYHFYWFFIASTILMLFAAMRLSSDVTGLRDASWLDLLKLTGITPWHWICMRFIQIGISFTIMWMMRIPILLLIVTLGGLRTDSIIKAECLLLFITCVAVCVGQFGTYAGGDRRRVWGLIWGVFIGSELLLYLPKKLLSLPLFSQIAFKPLVELADQLTTFRLVSVYRSAMSGGMLWSELWLPMLLYGSIACISLVWFSAIVFRKTSGEGGQTNSKSVLNRNQKESKRCWDDALAWQASEYHGGGKRTERLRLGGYACALGLAFLFLYYGMLEQLWGLFAVAGPIAILMKVSHANNCLEREIKEQTLTTLLLTPYENVEFYLGWHRGVWKMLKYDLLICGTAAFIAIWFEPTMILVTLIVAVGILLSGPFLLLSALVPITLKGVPTSIAVVVVLITIILAGIMIGALASPIGGAVFSVFFLWIFNVFILKKLLPQWMDHKMLGVINNEG